MNFHGSVFFLNCVVQGPPPPQPRASPAPPIKDKRPASPPQRPQKKRKAEKPSGKAFLLNDRRVRGVEEWIWSWFLLFLATDPSTKVCLCHFQKDCRRQKKGNCPFQHVPEDLLEGKRRPYTVCRFHPGCSTASCQFVHWPQEAQQKDESLTVEEAD